ncbi:Signal transduction histidine kinase [Asanoa ishikariensis]|uniref:histidine kinase n=1 Tax=Asanoa ishikariensis TaxID=137265 RepID=A0A1H3UH88_9ACTN|nr:sensor histidine kinase [Asanoa ishikariensis]SDZ61019.1 Signal transduction histidine kinase [Asanoa ishikariensis]
MRRALAALTVAAFVTLLVDVVAAHRSAVSLGPAVAFVLAATLGFGHVERSTRTWPRYAYIVALLLLGGAVFASSGGYVGATLLLVVLVSQTTLLLPLPAVAVVVALVPFFHAGMAFAEGLREGLGLLAAAVFAAVLTKLLLREQAARQQLREYAVQVEELAAVRERNRMARDIHDGLGHALTVVQMQIKAARAVLAVQPERADEVLAKAQDQAEEALREVRRSVGALRERQPAVPLPEALKALAAETSAAGVPTELEVTGPVRPLPDEAEESLFRAAQEGLTNVRKHARAGRAAVILDYSRPAEVRVEVRDDGAGTAAGSDGFGLLGLRERAAHVGGRMSLESVPGKGSTLRVEVPG